MFLPIYFNLMEVTVMPDLVPFQRGRSLLGSNHFEDFYSLLDDFFGEETPRRNPGVIHSV